MRVAVACDGEIVSPHFGRCDQYLLADIDGTDIQLRQWLQNPGHEPGALPELMRQQGVNVVVAGGAGPRAQQLLATHGIDLVMGATGDALQVLQALASGTLASGLSSCEHG